MPFTSINLDQFRHEIEAQIATGKIHIQIRQWLTTKGITVSKNTLSRRIIAWGASCRTRTLVSNPTLVSEIEAAFHTTGHNDQTIAQNITDQGVSTTRSQVKEIFLAQGLR